MYLLLIENHKNDSQKIKKQRKHSEDGQYYKNASDEKHSVTISDETVACRQSYRETSSVNTVCQREKTLHSEQNGSFLCDPFQDRLQLHFHTGDIGLRGGQGRERGGGESWAVAQLCRSWHRRTPAI